MQVQQTHQIVSGLGPFAEFAGIALLVALFTLLRGQADRRNYFNVWERSWIALTFSMLGGLLYQRLIDPFSVLYPGTPAMTFGFAAVYFGAKFLALAVLIAGIGLLVSGQRDKWSTRVAPVLGVVLALALDTRNSSVNALVLGHGIFAIVAYAFGASRFLTLPVSRRSSGTRAAAAVLTTLSVFWAFLLIFQLSVRMGAASSTDPWSIRVDRYSFFIDLVLQLALAYAMVRLLFEDGKRENDDTRAQLKIRQDRDQMAGLVDETTGLLNRAAYHAQIGLDFAKASFGSVVRLRLTNEGASEPGRVDGSRVAFFAAQLDSAVRTHDRVYRWSDLEFLVVMPRATPEVAENRMMFIITRAAPFAVAGARQSIRADAIVAVHGYRGGEDLGAAVEELARDPRLS